MSRGHPLLAQWLGQAEACWAARSKDSKRTRTVLQRLDFGGGLTAQFLQPRRYVVVYAAAAREMVAAVLDTAPGFGIQIDGGEVALNGLSLEHQVYWYSTDSRDEALYLCAWLNAQSVDEAVRPRAVWGRYRERHLEKRPLELPLPRFNPKDADHVQMAACAEEAAAKAPAIAASVKTRSLGALRRAIRTHADIAPVLARIDELARKIGGL